jgi:hypothetical protein
MNALRNWFSASCASLALLAGCASSQPDPQWIGARVQAGNERLLLDVTEIALRKTGFPVGAGLDPANLTATSGWKIALEPFKGKGTREQAIVKYSRAKPPGTFHVEVRVRRERNDDLVKPMDLTYAEWEPEADDAERARVVLHFVESLLSTGEEVLRKPREPRDPH